jgi:hypothetical protein
MSAPDGLAVGGRYLLRKLYTSSVSEFDVQEISPSGRRFKSGGIWYDFNDYLIEECLPKYASNEMPDLG